MNVYFERYAYPKQLFRQKPDPELKIIVVIPCFNEPEITPTLNSLLACQPVEKVEIIMIVNESEEADELIKKNNLSTLAEISTWQGQVEPWFNLLTYHAKLPPKDAGVGLARKAGMDEAARRFEMIGRKEGVIACYDADSTCAKNYFKALEQAYYQAEKTPVGSSIYYEHPFPKDPSHRNGIIQYELHLRYYVHALRWAAYPNAHQTVGSSMVVRADMYQKIGGMNKRKAGEDFYFLHRLIPTGNFTDIVTTCLYPSPRVSQRVPFGTGKAMEKWQQNNSLTYESYNLKSFEDLKTFFSIVDDLFVGKFNEIIVRQPLSVTRFLKADNFEPALYRLKKQSTTVEKFRKNFYAYFDGFKVLKFLHFSRDNYHPNKPIVEVALKLSQLRWPQERISEKGAADLLSFYRSKDQKVTSD
jgi:glycosyltransferase involved in cell wall biosynthesis